MLAKSFLIKHSCCRTLQAWTFSRKSSTNKVRHKFSSAGILVIGDEILKGEVADTNSRFLAQELHKLGVKLQKISVVEDNLKSISQEVKMFSSTYDYVLTTGGIGPTHDDVTYEGRYHSKIVPGHSRQDEILSVANAFNESLYLNPYLKEIVKSFYKTDDPLYVGMKLAYIPKSSKLFYKSVHGKELAYPNVSVKNVYMFPGIPELLKKQFNACGPLLFPSGRKFYTKCIYCNLPEIQIVKELDQIVDEFPDVQFGCYPKISESLYKVKITVESFDEQATLEAYERLLSLIPEESIVNLDLMSKDL